MISGKNQIVRQKNVDSQTNLNITSSIKDEFQVQTDVNADISDEIEQINESIAKLTYRLNTEEDEIDHFTFNASGINFDLTPSSSSSSSSPSNLLHTNNYDKSSKSITSNNSQSSVPSASFASNQNSPNNSTSSINNANLSNNYSNKNLNQLKEKLTKEKISSLNRQLMSTNSIPITQPKQRRFANLMRLTQANSFFSRSCPGEEITSQNENLSNLNEDNRLSQSNNSAVTVNRAETKFLGKNFNLFSSKNKAKKLNELSSNSPITSSTNSVNSDSLGMIGSYQVDLEKLARELILPSVDAPITSFKTDTISNTKPQLQASKTIDSDIKPRKNLIRSMTQNK